MEIRKATLKDNLEEIATLIYYTDKFIYPYWFKKDQDYKPTLVKLIKSKGSLFYYKNIFVATQNNHIYGIVVCFDDKSVLDYDYTDLSKVNKHYAYTIKKYVVPVSSHKQKGFVYISNVCVANKYRRQHIGRSLLENLFKVYPNKNFELDVIANNVPALKLYTKQGFEIVKKLKGFNGPFMIKPKIYTMQKIVNKQ